MSIPKAPQQQHRPVKEGGLNGSRRQATVYDAVAGRVSSTGFLSNEPRVSTSRDTLSSTSIAVPPEEVLFRRRGAPTRYEENDIYWADKHLLEGQKLPESDLLKAIHTYTSDFYGAFNEGVQDYESFDETALLALGILLEETAGHVLGDTGDLVFVEGEEVVDTHGDNRIADNKPLSQNESQEGSKTSDADEPHTASAITLREHKRKKRKLKHDADEES